MRTAWPTGGAAARDNTFIDVNGNGRSDFLVMNGYFKHPGPVRLLATRP